MRVKLKAYTLVEFILVVLIISLLCFLSYPNFSKLVAKTDYQLIQESVINHIKEARENAFLTQYGVSLCGTEDGLSCSLDWSQGFLIFKDKFARGQVSSDNIIQHIQLHTAQANLQWQSSLHIPYLHIMANGFTDFQNGSFYLIDAATHKVIWQIILNRALRMRVNET